MIVGSWHARITEKSVSIRGCPHRVYLWAYLVGRPSSWWVAPFLKQGVLNCVTVEKSSWIQASKWTCMYFFLLLTVDVTSCLSSCLDFSTIMEFNLDLKAQINSFYPKLLFVQLFYWSNRNETEHLLNLRLLRKMFLFTYIGQIICSYDKRKEERNCSAFYMLCLNQITQYVLKKHVHVNESIGEVYSIEICLAVLGASYHYATYVNNCRGPHHLSIDATWFSWFPLL